MLAFPSMLVAPALKAGMTTPDDHLLHGEFDTFKETHPHFFVFCLLQLARPMTAPTEHWDNAKVVAEVPLDRLKTMTVRNWRSAGVVGI